MADREKVIKGLEACLRGPVGCQTDCPYLYEDGCRKRMEWDALELLKEQQKQSEKLDEEVKQDEQ